MMKNLITHFLLVLFTAFLLVCNLEAATINVSSISALQTAINSAASGDIITVTSGHYTNNTISISKSNITVKAATAGGVYLDGTNAITISGNNNTFSGFQFTTNNMLNGQIVENPTNVVTVSGNYNTITQLNFNGYSASKMVQLEGQYNVVSYCNFQNKPALNNVNHGGDGDMVQIIPNATNPGYNTIRYCSFQHMPGFGGDFGDECIRIGDGAYSTYISRTVVEYCYFEDTGLGDSEAISVKSMENVLRYNTMNNNQNAMFCFRNGDNNVAYGNFFINSGGIRCKQSNNVWIYNNYFEQAGTGQDLTLPGSGAKTIYFLTYAGYNDNYNVFHNTFYKCGESEIQSGMTNCTWANNIIYSNSGNIFSSSSTTSGQTFLGNIYSGTLGLSIAGGMTKTDPKLTLNADGYYSLSSSSPAIDAANASYPAILDIANIDDDPTLLFDISGKNRPATLTLKDVGATEYNASGTSINKPLTLSNVGPSYLGGPVVKQNQTITFSALPSKTYTSADFAPGAVSNSGLTVSYASSNTNVATIVNGLIHITGVGTSTITASQAGDASYNAATDVTQTLTVTKASQTITFPTLSSKTYGDADFAPGGSASSALTVSYASSNSAVATVVNGQIHIVGVGSSTITASQAGDANYNAATSVQRTLTVAKAAQTISFGALSPSVVGDADFDPAATASSGLTVSYSSSNTAVATVVSGLIHPVAAGTTNITASQAGNANYNAATSVIQSLTVAAAKISQTITFNALPKKGTSDADFDPAASSTSGLTISYSSSNTDVATIVNGLIHIVGAGTSTITASQSGNSTYKAATDATQLLTVENTAVASLTLNPVADSYVNNSSSTSNFGTSTDLAVKKGSGTANDRLTYLKFDLSAQNIFSLTSAKVRLYANSISAATPVISVTASQTTDDWTETGLIFTNAPAKGTDIASVPITAASTYYEWDVTSYIQSQLNSNDYFISLVFSDLSTGVVIVKFNSKEVATNKPELNIVVNQIITSNPAEKQQEVRVFNAPGSSVVNMEYTLAEDAPVWAQIVNLHGEVVKTIFGGNRQTAGFHKERTDVSNLNLGFYFVRLSAGHFTRNCKLFIQR